MFVNKIIGQMKAFYKWRVPEPSCARKETVDIDVPVTSRNGDRKLMQCIRIMSRENPISYGPGLYTTSLKISCPLDPR